MTLDQPNVGTVDALLAGADSQMYAAKPAVEIVFALRLDQ